MICIVVSPHTIQEWILKGCSCCFRSPTTRRFTPYDPRVDTERAWNGARARYSNPVSPHTIQEWILKVIASIVLAVMAICFTPYDPRVDTESSIEPLRPLHPAKFHPIRSKSGY